MADTSGKIARLERGVSLAEAPLTGIIRLDVRAYQVFFPQAGGDI